MKMYNVYLNLSIFTKFLKNRNFISKIRRSKVTDYRFNIDLLSKDYLHHAGAFLKHLIEYSLLRGSGEALPVWGQG